MQKAPRPMVIGAAVIGTIGDRAGLEVNDTIGQVSTATTPKVSSQASTANQPFTLWQRFLLWLITGLGVLAIRLIGPTLRTTLSFEDGGPAGLETRPMILSFWHNCIFPAIYLWRDRQIRVMSSDSFDGEWTGRIIRKFGFVKIRGSSSHGAVRGLLGMRREIEAGATVAFTIDGPRGPQYVAKPGPVVLARATGAPMVAFHIALEDAWVLNTWDRLMIPKPFSRALMRVSRGLIVPAHANDEQRQEFHAELQASLDRVRQFAEANIGTPTSISSSGRA
jgi:lysophospholipid acyltransferase (LPLAT)-like uncharacterized protein